MALATDAFRHRVRKGSGVPYLAHLLQVTVTVAEHGGDEDQLIAAVLHDYLEDIAGATQTELRDRFGPRVCAMVVGLSDSTTHPKPPWKQRKEQYIAQLRVHGADIKLISAADKLHNAQSIRRDMGRVGLSVFDRFTATQEQTLWYYRAVVEALCDGWAHDLLEVLRAEVEAIHTEVAALAQR